VALTPSATAAAVAVCAALSTGRRRAPPLPPPPPSTASTAAVPNCAAAVPGAPRPAAAAASAAASAQPAAGMTGAHATLTKGRVKEVKEDAETTELVEERDDALWGATATALASAAAVTEEERGRCGPLPPEDGVRGGDERRSKGAALPKGVPFARPEPPRTLLKLLRPPFAASGDFGVVSATDNSDKTCTSTVWPPAATPLASGMEKEAPPAMPPPPLPPLLPPPPPVASLSIGRHASLGDAARGPLDVRVEGQAALPTQPRAGAFAAAAAAAASAAAASGAVDTLATHMRVLARAPAFGAAAATHRPNAPAAGAAENVTCFCVCACVWRWAWW